MILIQVVNEYNNTPPIGYGLKNYNTYCGCFRFDWIMQKGIKRLPGFNYVDNKNKITL